MPDATAAEAAAMNEQQRLSCDGPRAAATMRARSVLDIRSLAPLVRAPTMVLHSAGDRVVPIELGRELAASIPGARFESLPSSNHVPLASEAAFERFCAAIEDFVGAPTAGPTLTTRERDLAALAYRQSWNH